MKAVGYVRVSTEKQKEEGISLEAQEEAVRAYCELRGLNLVEVVVDAGVSAGKPLAKREGGCRILNLVQQRKVQAVIAYKLDRLFRDCSDCLAVTSKWDQLGVAVHLLDMGGQTIDTSTAMGRFFLTVMAGAAEMERNLIRERTSAAMAHMASRGEYTGGEARYGYSISDDGSTLVEDASEQETIRLALRLYEAGYSLNKIGQLLGRKGFLSRTGKQFKACQVKKMLEQAA